MARLNCGRAEGNQRRKGYYGIIKEITGSSLLWYQMDTDWPTSEQIMLSFQSGLTESGRIPGAVAMDVNRGPLLRAQANIREHGQEKRIGIRISDGFAALKQGEVDSAVIAGMEGR